MAGTSSLCCGAELQTYANGGKHVFGTSPWLTNLYFPLLFNVNSLDFSNIPNVFGNGYDPELNR